VRKQQTRPQELSQRNVNGLRELHPLAAAAAANNSKVVVEIFFVEIFESAKPKRASTTITHAPCSNGR
jgi:hypothetical protein